MSIFEAAETGDCEKILQKKFEVDCQNKVKMLCCIPAALNKLTKSMTLIVCQDGNTLLMLAAKNGHAEVVKILLGLGADKSITNKEHNTAFLVACQEAQHDVLRELLIAMDNPNFKNVNGDAPLHIVTKTGQITTIALLIDNGADIDARNENGMTALSWACYYGMFAVAQLLLRRGANVNTRTKGGVTPLIEAVGEGFEDIVRLLLQHSADTNIKTIQFHTSALSRACEKGRVRITKLLLDAGANPHHHAKLGTNNLSVSVIAKDANLKRLIECYKSAGGPSWLAKELSARGLEWGMVCEIEDKLLPEGLTSPQSLSEMPLEDFTHAYLLRLGVASYSARRVLLALRLESTWLGRRLAPRGFDAPSLEECERLLVGKFKCCTEELFVRLVRPDLLAVLSLHKPLSPLLLDALGEIQAEIVAERSV